MVRDKLLRGAVAWCVAVSLFCYADITYAAAADDVMCDAVYTVGINPAIPGMRGYIWPDSSSFVFMLLNTNRSLRLAVNLNNTEVSSIPVPPQNNAAVDKLPPGADVSRIVADDSAVSMFSNNCDSTGEGQAPTTAVDTQEPAAAAASAPSAPAPDPASSGTAITRSNVSGYDLRQPALSDHAALEAYINAYPGLCGFDMPDLLLECQSEYGVNAIFLLAIIRLESGNGSSSLARSRGNLGGIVAAGVYRDFTSEGGRAACLVYMAQLLGGNYLTPGGRYFSGDTVRDVAPTYAAGPDWADAVEQLMVEIQASVE